MAQCKYDKCERQVGDVSPKSQGDRAAQVAGFCSSDHLVAVEGTIGTPEPVKDLEGSERLQAGWE